MKHRKNRWIRGLCALGVLLLLLVAGIAILNFVELRWFYQTATPEFLMPGIDDSNFDEQGIEYDEDTGLFFFTGYMRDGSANPVYLVEKETGDTIGMVRLQNEDGSNFCGHAGGIAVTDRYVYIAGSVDSCLYVFEKAEILQAENGQAVTCIGAFPTALSEEDGVKVSFVSHANGKIYVGEFHFPLIPLFRLRENHRLSTQNGNNEALMVGFDIDPDAPFGLSGTPTVAYSLPDKVQGLCFSGEYLVLSRSFSMIPASVSFTRPVPEGTFTILGTEVPLYSLQTVSQVRVPPVSEEIEEVDGKLYIASELCHAFVPNFGRPWGAGYCWSIPNRGNMTAE